MRLAGIRRRMVRVNRIYIVPSGRGFVFLGLIVVMILTAATYNNNLIFMLAFLLFAVFSVSMLQTHHNLKSVRLDFVAAEDAVEGGALRLLFHLNQKRARAKEALELRSTSRRFANEGPVRERLRADERVRPVSLPVRAAAMGAHPVPAVVLETYFPLGLFRAWKVFRPEGAMLVYPRPEGAPFASEADTSEGVADSGGRAQPLGDFGELRPYRDGDSYRHVAWKHFARTRELLTKTHWGASRTHYELEVPGALGAAPLEAHLRRLSRTIACALEEDASFALTAPGRAIGSGRGAAHAARCRRALALARAGAA